jgi:transcription elongation GreA/GreB family factor
VYVVVKYTIFQRSAQRQSNTDSVQNSDIAPCAVSDVSLRHKHKITSRSVMAQALLKKCAGQRTVQEKRSVTTLT